MARNSGWEPPIEVLTVGIAEVLLADRPVAVGRLTLTNDVAGTVDFTACGSVQLQPGDSIGLATCARVENCGWGSLDAANHACPLNRRSQQRCVWSEAAARSEQAVSADVLMLVDCAQADRN
jgi:hypothetical protein